MVPRAMIYAGSKILGWIVVLIILMLLPGRASSGNYALTLYGGKYSDDRLGHVLLSKPVEFVDSYVAVAALSRIFTLQSRSHQWELEGQLGKHYDGQDHWEFNILALYRWQRFPWNDYLKTSAAIGDGFSYASETPPLEAQSTTNEGATRLLNYILVEFTFAPPQVDNWALVVRVHHRSGVYGLFNDVEGGSNVLAAGVKIKFD